MEYIIREQDKNNIGDDNINIQEKWADYIENFTWSFSRLNGFGTGCKYCWFENYANKRRDSTQNAFAEYGLMMHEILEGLDKEELMLWDAVSEFEKGFEDVSQFPANKWVNLRDRYFEQGIDYLSNYEVDERYEVVSVEENVKAEIKGYKFTGYIDKILRDKEDGKLIVLDHKSKSKFKSKREQKEYARQLYLYAYAVKQIYGEYPKSLVFNMFRVGDIVEIDFKIEDMNESIDWMLGVIEDIKQCSEFPVTDDKFFGGELCNFRHDDEHTIGEYRTLWDWIPQKE